MATVLLVEDDPAARQGLELALRRLGYGVRAAETGEAALRDFRDAAADVVVLDVMLPGLDGFEVCRRLRRDSDIPVIMLTARDDDLDIVGGLEAGADDYVVKPVEPRVLDARIRAVLRRTARTDSPAETYGELMIDRGSLIVQQAGQDVSLPPTELRLLLVLPGWSTRACSGCGRRSRPTRPSPATSRPSGASDTGSGRCIRRDRRDARCGPAWSSRSSWWRCCQPSPHHGSTP